MSERLEAPLLNWFQSPWCIERELTACFKPHADPADAPALNLPRGIPALTNFRGFPW